MIREDGSAAETRSGNGYRATGYTDRALSSNELVVAGAIQCGKTLTCAAIAVSDRVRIVDAGILHLDDEQEVSDCDCRTCPRGRTYWNGGGSRCDACGSGIISVQGTGQIVSGSGLRNGSAGKRLHCSNSYVRIVASI